MHKFYRTGSYSEEFCMPGIETDTLLHGAAHRPGFGVFFFGHALYLQTGLAFLGMHISGLR